MPLRASPYTVSVRRPGGREGNVDKTSAATQDDATYAQTVCLRVQEALYEKLPLVHCSVSDVSVAELQYRLLGARKYCFRSIKQEKSGLKRWEARYYETAIRRSTLEALRGITAWHRIPRLSADDVQLKSIGMFDSEKQATQAMDAAFKARETANPFRTNGPTPAASATGSEKPSKTRRHEPLPPELSTRFQVVVVSEVFARKTQRQRLALVYEILLDAFAIPTSHTIPRCPSHQRCRVRGFSLVGEQVASLPLWRALPFHITVVAKTPAQWKPISTAAARPGISDTERFGQSHLRNDRALGVDTSILPLSRGLMDLLASSNNQLDPNAKLPHFYHGLPDELKRMIAEEQEAANEMLTQAGGSKAFQRLSRNSEAGFMQKYQKRRREIVLAAIRIQRLLRRNTQGKILRYIFAQHRAGLRIQSVYRGHRDRVFVNAYRTVMHCASTIVQAVYRSHVSRERTKRLRRAMHSAALQIQRVYRGHVGRTFARWVRQKASSALKIERVVRGFMARRRAARLRLAKLKRKVWVPAAVNIQRVYRGFLGRRIALEKREVRHRLRVLNPSALRIGRILRGFLARRTAKRFRLACHSAMVIQKHWRSHRYYQKWMALMELRRRDKMASKIGALGRGYVARHFFKREKRRVYMQYVVQPAAIRIQRVFRGYVVRKLNEDLRDRIEAAITLQQMWRKRSRIKTIQNRLGGFRVAIRHANATRIQYWYKCCKAKVLFAYLQAMQRATHGKATLVIQCAWRSYCSRKQLNAFRICSRIERKAQALTKSKDEREDIEFDIRDARADLKRTIKYKAKSLRRIKELKEMRLEWERRQPVVEKELSELTQEDIDRGWGEAFQTEKHILRFQLELSVEDILGRRAQIREYEAEIEDLRLELEDLERDLEECVMNETMELEDYRDMEFQQAQRMFTAERERKIRLQRVRWGIRNDRKKVIHRARDDLKIAEQELLAQRQVQELGILGFDKKLLLKEKIESAIERVVQDRAKQNEVMMEMNRDAKVVAGFDDAIQRMHKITSEYSFEYRVPKHDLRELENSPMCEGCGRISCGCEEQQAEREALALNRTTPNNIQLSPTKKSSRAFGTHYGHPLRRKRNYELQ